MKVLKTNKRVLKWLSLYTVEENAAEWKKLVYILSGISVFIGVVCMATSSGLFFLAYFSTDLEEALYGYGQFNAIIGPFYMLIVALVLRKKIIAMINGLSEIYEENKNEDSFHYLNEANENSEWVWAIYFKYIIKAFLIMIPLSTIVSVIICLVNHGTFDVKYMYRPYRLLLPWNTQTLVGYFGEILFSLIANESYCIANGAFMLLLVSMSLHHKAFYKMFRHSLRKMECHNGNGNQNDKQILSDLIRFHVSVKRWFFESVDVYSSLVMIVLIGNMLYLAGALFLLDLVIIVLEVHKLCHAKKMSKKKIIPRTAWCDEWGELSRQMQISYSKHMDFNFIFLLMVTFVSCANLFIYCFYGQMTTESFAKMSYCLYDANWQNLPIELQKHFVIMIGNAQLPISYHGFGIAILDLETFTNMVRAAFSYYMMFKTLTSN